MLSIRSVKRTEVSELCEISLHTFKDTYEALNDPNEFKAYLEKYFNIDEIERQLDASDSYFFFVETAQEIVAYYKLNINSLQTEDKGEDFAEIERIYVLPKYKRQGIGQKMVEHACQKAIELGKRKLWLGVWEKNDKAIAFYQKMGFFRNGTHTFVIGNEKQLDYIMEKDL